MRFIMRVDVCFIFLLAAMILLGAGCSSPLFEGSIFDHRDYSRTGGPQAELAQVKTSSEMTNLECQRLAEQINALNRNQQQLDTRLRNIEASINSSATVDQSVVALRRDLEQVRVERDQLRKEITTELAGKIEVIAAQQQKSIDAARLQTQQAPTRSASTSAPGSGYEHKVERGQTLSEIARGYNTTVSKISKANNITDASTIRVGQVLFIPD